MKRHLNNSVISRRRATRNRNFEILETRELLAYGHSAWESASSQEPQGQNQVVISEFLASNDHDIEDYFGSRSDWIELRNHGSLEIDVEGWFLTDDINDKTKWQVPDSRVLGPGEHLVVIASGRNTATPDGEFHTNFSLRRRGEYLGLVQPNGISVMSDFSPQYPTQTTDISFGVTAQANAYGLREFGYLEHPTPGEDNVIGFGQVISAPMFSTERVTFVDSFQVEIESPTGVIRYTVDGTIPGQESPRYDGPLLIDSTIQIHARVYSDGALPSSVASQTFVKIDSGLGDFTSDLPVVVVENFQQGVPGREFVDGFLALFDSQPSGITHLDSVPSRQSQMGFQRRGASTFENDKSNYRVELRDEYGRDRNLPLLGMAAESDWILFAPYKFDRALLRNAFLFELSNEIGQYAVQTRFVEVFANTNDRVLDQSDYMGLYVLMETVKRDAQRVDLQELTPRMEGEPEITGGYIVKIDRGDPPDIWETSGGRPTTAPDNHFVHVEPTGSDLAPQQREYIRDFIEQFDTLLYSDDFANSPEGFDTFIDVESFINEHWLRLLSKDPDGLRLSTFMTKDRDGKLKMGPIWDLDRSMGADVDNRAFSPAGFVSSIHYLKYDWWGRLFSAVDFNQKWIDRWSELRQTDQFSMSQFTAIIDRLAERIAEAQERNFQRWPEVSPVKNNAPGLEFSAPELEGWEAEVSHLKGWLDARLQWLDAQFLDLPQLSTDSGSVVPGFEITVASDSGEIYYTTDGSDPRALGGSISPSATRYGGVPIHVDTSKEFVFRAFDSTGGPLTTWSGPVHGIFKVHPQGDFDGNRVINSSDVSLLSVEVATGSQNPTFDLNEDGEIDLLDMDVLVKDILGTSHGDADLDGDVDYDDFSVLAANFGAFGDWSSGDFDGDGHVTFTDFTILSNSFGFGG